MNPGPGRETSALGRGLRRFLPIAIAGVAGFFIGRHPLFESGTHDRSGAARGETPVRSASVRAPAKSRSETVAASKDGAFAAVWTERWRALQLERDTPARDRMLCAELEALARTDPAHAMALAQAEPNWRLRDLLRAAALRGWAATAPAAAGDWVLALQPENRRPAIAAVLEGAAGEGEAAAQLGTRFCAADPVSAADYAQMTISSLGQAGAFDAAARFAANVDGGAQPWLLTSAYAQWAERNPQDALAALGKIADETARRSAFEGLVNGWASANPAEAADYAESLAPGVERTAAFSAALSQWVERDSSAATAWIERHDPGRDADDGIASVANLPTLVESHPETALQWANLIADPTKRGLARESILSRWAARDPAGAKRYTDAQPASGTP